MPTRKSLICIGGPTASGKSYLALRLAKSVGGELINADSMQVYEGLSLLSAQPSQEMLNLAQHHLYGHVLSHDTYNTAQWLHDACQSIEEVQSRGKTPLIVGGTGLYFKALSEGLSPVPPIKDAVRQTVRHLVADEGIGRAYQLLCEKAPQSHKFIHPNDKQRIIRSLEVMLATGIPLYEWHQKAISQKTHFSSLMILLVPSRDLLLKRIERRIDKMIEMGAIEEVQQLLSAKPVSATMEKTLGFMEIKAYLAGAIPKDEMRKKILVKTRQYAKRQMTWFRNQWCPDFIFNHVGEDVPDQAIIDIHQKLKEV